MNAIGLLAFAFGLMGLMAAIGHDDGPDGMA